MEFARFRAGAATSAEILRFSALERRTNDGANENERRRQRSRLIFKNNADKRRVKSTLPTGRPALDEKSEIF